jgi:ABC-type dipeptide/oligopeptide/nickel transport system ATPase component
LHRDGSTLFNLRGDIAQQRGDAKGAIAHYRRALDVVEELYRDEPTEFRYAVDIAFGLGKLVDTKLALGDTRGALEDARRAETVLAGVSSTANSDELALQRAKVPQRLGELLARTGIPEPHVKVAAYPHQLSGGQRQRAMIAMALACRPKLLIADEPTTALDVTIQVQILALLDDLQREYGMAILFITHDLNLVRRFTHRVGVMERGVLVEQGPTAQVFTHPQHPYTIKLINSRPERLVTPVPAGAPVLAAANDVSVEFKTAKGWFKTDVFHAVRNATLELRRGETLGIVGESGSGKTTLGMAMLALQPIAGGSITLEGQRIDDADRAVLRAMRRRMQVVGATVVPEAGPVLEYEIDRRGRERSHVGEARDESLVIRTDGGDLRLLQHHLGQPDPVRIARPLPRKVMAAMPALPRDETRGERRRAGHGLSGPRAAVSPSARLPTADASRRSPRACAARPRYRRARFAPTRC